MNAMIDIALPIPRNINAGNKNITYYINITNLDFNLCRSIPFQEPSNLSPRQIAQILWCA